ncbi:glycosyltransferase [Pelagibius marinus]|uniref:glycosyltransferase n=1 Tax=Pelagibius marinus TaxID=2762760 RepID=UPI0018730A00|nr:glycosyltransferase [Pelagibius marinus]
MQHEPPQIFAFASNEWHTPWWMARQHLFTRLARRGWAVVYSTGPQSLWERHTDKWRRGGFVHNCERVETGGSEAVIVDQPGRCLPLWREGAWNTFATGRHARHLLRAGTGKSGRLAYLWHPRFWPYVELLEADYVVYHIHDAWNSDAWADHLKRRHEKLVQRADLIIATAENMSRNLPGIGPGGARILPHGVDFAAVTAGAGAACPADLAAIPRPRIGYTGRVNLKLDFPLIADLAARRPELHWVFVGATGIGNTFSFDAQPKVKAEWDRVNSLDNVHFLGVKNRREIPAYLHGCDILSLPFNASCVGFPTKLYEYLASGKPVISWNAETMSPYSEMVHIASTCEEWSAAIEDALTTGGRGTPEARRSLARFGDWNRRTDQLEDWLREVIGGDSAQAAQ